MHICWTFEYALKEKDPDHPGQLKDFDPCHKSYTAHVEAPTDVAAVIKLKRDFHMLTVKILTLPKKYEMSDAEYNRDAGEIKE